MAVNDVFLRPDAGDGANGVRLRQDTPDVTGTLAVTLDSLTAAATGTVREPYDGSEWRADQDPPTADRDDYTADGNAPDAVAAVDRPSGGYGAGNDYNAARQRRKRRNRDDDESKPPAALSSVAQAGPGSSVATQTAPAADLELVRNLVAYWTGEADRNELNRRAQRALDYALRAQTVLAMQLFERELARQMEDDDTAALLMILADD